MVFLIWFSSFRWSISVEFKINILCEALDTLSIVACPYILARSVEAVFVYSSMLSGSIEGEIGDGAENKPDSLLIWLTSSFCQNGMPLRSIYKLPWLGWFWTTLFGLNNETFGLYNPLKKEKLLFLSLISSGLRLWHYCSNLVINVRCSLINSLPISEIAEVVYIWSILLMCRVLD